MEKSFRVETAVSQNVYFNYSASVTLYTNPTGSLLHQSLGICELCLHFFLHVSLSDGLAVALSFPTERHEIEVKCKVQL